MEFNYDKFWTTVKNRSKPYCGICLHTDVKYTQAVNARNLLRLLKKPLFLKNNEVCVWCESACRRAAALVELIDAAFVVQTEPYNRKSDYKRRLTCKSIEHYWKTTALNYTNILLVDSQGVQRLQSNSSNLSNKPCSSVDSGDPLSVPPAPVAAPALVSPAPPPIAPRAPPTPPLLVPLPQLLEIKHLAKEVRIASILPDRSQMIVRDGKNPESFALHPAINMNDGTMVVPSLNLVVDTSGHSLVIPGCGSNVVQTPATSAVQVASVIQTGNGQIQIGQPTAPLIHMNQVNQMSNTNKTVVIPTNSVQHIAQMNRKNSSLKAIIGSNFQNSGSGQTMFLTLNKDSSTLTTLPKGLGSVSDDSAVKLLNLDLGKETHLDQSTSETVTLSKDRKRISLESKVTAPKKPCQAETTIDLDRIIDLIAETEKAEAEAESKKAENPKQAVPKSDKIDWEDKIPMDVISFMDATDPQAMAKVPPPVVPPPPMPVKAPPGISPFGVISEVRSERSDDKQSHSDPLDPFKRNPEESGTISIVFEEDDEPELIEDKVEPARYSPEFIVADSVYDGNEDFCIQQSEVKSESGDDEIIDLC